MAKSQRVVIRDVKAPSMAQSDPQEVFGLFRRPGYGSSGVLVGKLPPVSLQVWEQSKGGHKQPGKVLHRGSQIKTAAIG